MRDSERIDRVLAKVRQAWKKCPDLRFCQLVVNIAAFTPAELFAIEDDDFETALAELETFIDRCAL